MTDIPLGYLLPILVMIPFWIAGIVYYKRLISENHYNTDMREHYNKHYFEQLVKQSGVKNSPEYFDLKIYKLENHIHELKEWSKK